MRCTLPLIALAFAAACSPGESSDTEPSNIADVEESPLITQGRAIAEANCAECHALDADSESPHEDAPAFRTLSENYPVSALGESLAEGIVVGHPDMPEYSFEPAEVDALLAFIESVQPGSQN